MLGRSRRAVKRLRQGPQAQPADARRKSQRGTPPNVAGKGPLLSTPGLRLGVVVIIKNEALYLEEWLAYHRALGVEHFFIYDNGSTDELHEVLERWVNHGLVTMVYWPLPGGQIDAYSHALRFYGPSLEWLAFFDVDEFIVPLVDDDIPTLLARWPDAADVRIPRVDFGFSGHRTPPKGSTIEAYTERANVFGRDPAKPPRVKTILRPQAVSAIGIHTATVADVPASADGRAVPTRTVGRECHAYVQLDHYYTRSFEEFEAKRFRGSGTGRIARPAIPFDLPSEGTDTAALRFVDRTKAMIAHMRSLEPSPYRYGSELQVRQFPRFDDLGLFTEFAIANIVMEEPEPRREPRLRIENHYAGYGFVGDIGGYDHDVKSGELSGSRHLEPLLQRCRGRLEAVAVVDPHDQHDEMRLDIESHGQRRCYALGFVIETAEAVGLTAATAYSGGTVGESVDVRLEGATTYAGVVELDASPNLVTSITAHLLPSTGEAIIHDLFVISYG